MEKVGDAALRRMAATLVVFGFEGDAQTPNEHAKRMIKRGCASTILFGRNVRKPEQVKELCSSLKVEAQPHKLLVMTDQEGGRVARLRENFTELPPARTIASCSDTPAVSVTRMAKVMASELKAVQIDMDLAPVVDVDSNPKNPVIDSLSLALANR
jgi:beta-N-acetylhexosaminidase